MNGIEQIRESRQGGYYGQCLEAERHVDYLLSEVDRLSELLERVRKMQAVVSAVVPFVNDYDFWMVYVEGVEACYFCPYCNTYSSDPHGLRRHPHKADCPAKAIIEALAAYEQAGEGD